jgi:hypothetical protein
MSTDVVIVCPACEQSVIPIKRRAPSVKVTTENGSTPYSAPSIGFGWFCPNDSCKCRLDKQVEQAQQEAAADEPKVDVLPANESEQEEPKPRPVPRLVKVSPVKQSEKVDLFTQIRQAHERALHEERELTERLAKVREDRERLDRLVQAMDGMQPTAIAAE